VRAEAAGQTDASAEFYAEAGGGQVWAFSGKDAIALSASIEIGEIPRFPDIGQGEILSLIPEQIIIFDDDDDDSGFPAGINVAASTLFAGTLAEGGAGGEFTFKASANAINDPPRPRFPIDPVAFVSSPLGEAYAEIGALRGTAQASSNLEGGVVGGGGGIAGNLAIGLGLGLVAPDFQLAGLGLATFAGAEGGGAPGAISLPVNDARMDNVYGNVYASFLDDGIPDDFPYEGPLTWARMREGNAWASAPDTGTPRTAGAAFGVLEAWGNPIAPFSIDLAIGGGIIPGNYWSLGGGIGLGVSFLPPPP
jgi:hypothetical protein